MRTLYDEIRSPRKPIRWKTLLPPAICVAVAFGLLGVFELVKDNREWMNYLIQNVTSPIKRGISWLFDPLPFGVAEVIWAVAALAAVGFLLRWLWLTITRGEKLLRAVRRLLALVAAVAFIYCGYTLLWGMNYYGDDFSDKSGIATRGASVEELAILNQAFVDQLNALAGEVQRDENGVFCENVDGIFSRTVGLYEGIEGEFPFLDAPDRAVNQMFFGPIVSRMGFTGFFFPFTGESLVNDDTPACLIPATILHEIAHQRNIAGEDECNFLAVVAGLRSGDAVYAYSSTLLGYIHLGNALYEADRDTYYAIRAKLDSRVSADLAANNAYWDQFDSPVEEAVEQVSTTVYENFLQSYDQTDGMKSYGKCVDLLVAYYFDYKWAE